jgi:hypothetical protein
MRNDVYQLLEGARSWMACDQEIALSYCEQAINCVLSDAPNTYSDNLDYWSWYWDVRDQVVAIVQSMPRG